MRESLDAALDRHADLPPGCLPRHLERAANGPGVTFTIEGADEEDWPGDESTVPSMSRPPPGSRPVQARDGGPF